MIYVLIIAMMRLFDFVICPGQVYVHIYILCIMLVFATSAGRCRPYSSCGWGCLRNIGRGLIRRFQFCTLPAWSTLKGSADSRHYTVGANGQQQRHTHTAAHLIPHSLSSASPGCLRPTSPRSTTTVSTTPPISLRLACLISASPRSYPPRNLFLPLCRDSLLHVDSPIVHFCLLFFCFLCVYNPSTLCWHVAHRWPCSHPVNHSNASLAHPDQPLANVVRKKLMGYVGCTFLLLPSSFQRAHDRSPLSF
jgi:hypothetical protein